MSYTFQWSGGFYAPWFSPQSWTVIAGTPSGQVAPGSADSVVFTAAALDVEVVESVNSLAQAASVSVANQSLEFLGTYEFGSLTIGDTTAAKPVTLLFDTRYATSVEVGAVGIATSGLITVDPGSTLTADGYAVLDPGLRNNGTVQATLDTLTIAGPVTNAGTLEAAGGDVTISGTLTNSGTVLASAGTVAIAGTVEIGTGLLEAGSHGDLVISTAQPLAGLLNLGFTGSGGKIEVGSFGSTSAYDISGFGAGDTLQLDGVNLQGQAVGYSHVAQSTPADPADALTVGAYTFGMPTGTQAGILFQVQGSGTTTTITAATQSDSYTWDSSVIFGYWSDIGNWTDVMHPGLVTAPGSQNSVAFDSTSTTIAVDGGGAANRLSVLGAVEFDGPKAGVAYSANTLAVGAAHGSASSLEVYGDTFRDVAGGSVTDGSFVAASGATATFNTGQTATFGLSLGGDAALNPTVAATQGSRIQVDGGLLLSTSSLQATPTVSVDGSSAIEIGTTGGAVVGTITIDAGFAVVSSGSAGTSSQLLGNVVNDGEINGGGNSMVIAGTLTGSGIDYVGTGGTLFLHGAAGTGNVIYLDSRSSLDIGAASTNNTYAVGSTIEGFSLGNGTLLLDNTTLTQALYTAGSGGLGTLALYDGSTVVEDLTLNGNYAGDSFALGTVGSAASIVVEAAVCYVRGTLIRTARGEVPIEHLHRGDRVIDSAGTYHPVQWLGHRRVDCTAAPNPREVWPIRVTAHAFGENLPDRDLYLSPGHSVRVGCIEEALVPIVHLINGATIARHPVEQVEYWHVELDQHAVILANNLPAESYIDMNNRDFFIDRGIREYQPAATVLPVQHSGPMVELARQQLRDRAQRLGWTPDQDPQPRLVIDGVEHPPLFTAGDVAQFDLPATARDVRLVSRTFVPADLTGGVGDGRVLGLSLHGIELRAGEQNLKIALDDERLDNPHGVEREADRAWRWTDGSLRLAPELWSSLTADSLTLRIRFDSSALRGYREGNPAPAAACVRVA